MTRSCTACALPPPSHSAERTTLRLHIRFSNSNHDPDSIKDSASLLIDLTALFCVPPPGRCDHSRCTTSSPGAGEDDENPKDEKLRGLLLSLLLIPPPFPCLLVLI
jgi:hypothetical protein